MWNPGDATKHTKRASTPTLKRRWAEIANSTYGRHGEEGRAIRTANSVVGKADSARKRAILGKQAESDSNGAGGDSPAPDHQPEPDDPEEQ